MRYGLLLLEIYISSKTSLKYIKHSIKSQRLLNFSDTMETIYYISIITLITGIRNIVISQV